MSIIEILFGCRHKKNVSFPITRRVQRRALPMYQVCLDCGKEIPYDWHCMQQARMRPVQTSGEQRRRVKEQKVRAIGN